jgi:hypothetical protein
MCVEREMGVRACARRIANTGQLAESRSKDVRERRREEERGDY